MSVHDGHRGRKKEQFLKNGDALADHELLEILLYYAIPRRDTNELAHRLLDRFGSLERVLTASAEELQAVDGLGQSAAVLLTLLPVIWRRTEQQGQEQILNSVERCGRYFLPLLRRQKRELLYQVCLDGKGKVLSSRCLAQGGVSMASLSIRQVVENALHTGAVAVVLAHNHPSGVALPSQEDRITTLQVRDALAVMDIRLVDHIIVADDDFVSMAASGMLL